MNELTVQLKNKTLNLMPYSEYVSDRFAKTFSDLLVRECAQAVQDMVDLRIPASEYPDRLKEHFGVTND